ncbi:MAG: hypothetical protein L0J60_01910 [Psychroflexus sp.]|nr:hypothetical protein [Psychroflexus sp.]
MKSNSDDWTKGKIKLRINKTKNDEFELFEYDQNGLLFYQKNIEISNGRIFSTFWNKEEQYFFNKSQKENFVYDSIKPSFDYISVKTLNRTHNLIKEADHFYANNLDRLK